MEQSIGAGAIKPFFACSHEMFHGLDNVNNDELLGLKVWWTPATKAKFENRSKCLLNQYGDRINEKISTRVQQENIADHGGTKLTYKAYGNSILT